MVTAIEGVPKQQRQSKNKFTVAKSAYEKLETRNRIANIPLVRCDLDFRFDIISGYPTTKDKTSTNSRLKNIQDQIYKDLFGNADRQRNADDKHHLIAITIGNMVRGHIEGRKVSVSLDIANLKKVSSSKAGVNISPNSRYINNRSIPAVFSDIIHGMDEHQLIDLVVGHRSLITDEGNLSTITAKGKLLSVISEVVESTPIDKLIHTIQDESIRLNKDIDIAVGRGKKTTIKTVKGLVDYEDNSLTKTMRAETLLINKTMAKNIYTFANTQVLFTPLHRVFNDDFDTAGRWYGGFHQRLSRYDRRNIFIDGSPVAEADYECCGVNIFYNGILNIPSPEYTDPEADHYTLSDHELNQIGINASSLEKRHYKAIRQFNKDIMLRMPNIEVNPETNELLISIKKSLKTEYKSEKEAAYMTSLLEITHNVNSQKINIKKSSDLAQIQSLAEPMILAMEIKHQILFDYVRDNGVQWGKIQAIDSDIMTKLLLHFTKQTIQRRDGTKTIPPVDSFSYAFHSTPALCVHDAVLVKQHHVNDVKAIMALFYKYKCKRSPGFYRPLQKKLTFKF